MPTSSSTDCYGTNSETSQVVTSNSNSIECITIYDWDDTILPTSWLRSLGYLSNNIADMVGTPPPVLPTNVASMMRMIEEAAVANLSAASQRGRVVIVTNSSVLWVPFTAKRFFPRLAQIVESGFEVYSARPAQAENAGPNYVYLPSMAVTWKTDKFRELVGSTEFSTCVSIGDGFAERCAVLAIASPKMSGKAVRYPLQPSGGALLEQLRATIACLTDIIHDCRTGDLYLNPQVGTYRVIPVVVSHDDTAIPLKMDASASKADTNPSSDKAAGAGLMQSLANGLATYGRTLSHRMSLGTSSSNKAPRESDSKTDKQPAVTFMRNTNQDENSATYVREETIRVEVRSTTRTL
jgi:hypothetical protein